MKRKISAREFVEDVRAGLTDLRLMDKYDLSVPAIHALFKKLVESGLMSNRELEQRMPLSERSVSLEVFRCPACNMPQFTRFEECPQCGVIVSKVSPSSLRASEPKSAGPLATVPKPLASLSQRDETFPPRPIGPASTSETFPDALQSHEDADPQQPADAPSPQPSATLQISVTIPADMLNELNSLGGDLSDHVTEAVDSYLQDRRKPRINQ